MLDECLRTESDMKFHPNKLRYVDTLSPWSKDIPESVPVTDVCEHELVCCRRRHLAAGMQHGGVAKEAAGVVERAWDVVHL